MKTDQNISYNKIVASDSKKKNTYLSNLKIDIKRDKYLYMLFFPFFLYMIIFQYLPMYGLQIAFKEFSPFLGIAGSKWVGFENFIGFFRGPYFIRTVVNTLTISTYSILIGFPIPIMLALMFNEVKNRAFKSIAQTITYLPYFISTVVVVGMITNFLSPSSGLVNVIINKFGVESNYFLTKPEYFKTIYVAMNVWKDAGFNAIIYIAALSAVNMELYEAAAIDGAKKMRQLWSITIPGIMPTIIIMFILRLGQILDVGYESIILLYQPATYSTADVISTYVYRAGLVDGNYSLGAAVGLCNSIVALALVFISNKISKSVSEIGIW